MIRSASLSDAAAICAIYNHYIENTRVTFEEDALPEAEIAARIEATLPAFPWLVWEEQGAVIGYAYANRWKSRSASRFTVESTVYLKHDFVGRGIGKKLYAQLIEDLRKIGLHSVLGCIALPNRASERLHEKLGFRKVGHFEQAGWKFKQWIDVGYWQLNFAHDGANSSGP